MVFVESGLRSLFLAVNSSESENLSNSSPLRETFSLSTCRACSLVGGLVIGVVKAGGCSRAGR